MSLNNHPKGCDYCDVITLLENEYDMLLEKVYELEKIVSDLDKIELEGDIYIKLFRLNNYIYTELIKYFNLEEDYLFKELERVLPDPSSPLAMKAEHLELLRLCNKIQNCLGDKEIVETKKEELQGLILMLADRLRRNIKKENILLHHEACQLLEPEVLDYVYYEMSKNLHTE